jgi:hypothetical protein
MVNSMERLGVKFQFFVGKITACGNTRLRSFFRFGIESPSHPEDGQAKVCHNRAMAQRAPVKSDRFHA